MTDGKALAASDLWEEFYTNLHRAYNAMRRAFVASRLSQDALAAKLGVDKALISKRLNGTENLTLKTLSFMATAMGCRLGILFTPYEHVQGAVVEPTIVVKTSVTSTRAIYVVDRNRLPRKAA